MQKILFCCLLISSSIGAEDPFNIGGVKVHCNCKEKWKKQQIDQKVLKKLPLHGNLIIKKEPRKTDGALGETRTHTS